MIGWQAGEPFSGYLCDAGRNEAKGQDDAAKNGEIADPLVRFDLLYSRSSCESWLICY